MKLEFSEGWSLGRNMPLDVIDREKARDRHINREPYVAMVGGRDNPRCVVELTADWVSVIFFDEDRHHYLRYDFRQTDSERLFLKAAYYWEYGDDGRQISRMIFNLSENGHTVMERISVGGDGENREHFGSVAENWERYPSFGEYDSLCDETRRNRPVA